jgi:hypothetical protein
VGKLDLSAFGMSTPRELRALEDLADAAALPAIRHAEVVAMAELRAAWEQRGDARGTKERTVARARWTEAQRRARRAVARRRMAEAIIDDERIAVDWRMATADQRMAVLSSFQPDDSELTYT